MNLTAICIHSKPVTERCEDCERHWADSAAYMGQVCAKCHKNRANHAWSNEEYWCVGNINEVFEVDVIASLKAGGERAFQDTLNHIDKMQAAGLSGSPVNMEPFRPSPSTCSIRYEPDEAASAAVIVGEENDEYSRQEFENDRMGQTGEKNARRMRERAEKLQKAHSVEVKIEDHPRLKAALSGEIGGSGTQHFAGGKGPHLLRDRKGNTAYCGGHGACEFCERGVPPSGDHHVELVEAIVLEHYSEPEPWIGGNRNIDPNNPEDVAAWKERDRQAAAMLEPSGIATNVVFALPETNFPVVGFTEGPKVDPAAFEFLDHLKNSEEQVMGIDPKVFAEEIDPHAKSIAAHSHVLSSADPKPKIVDTRTAAAAVHEALSKKKPAELIAAKEKKQRRNCKFCGKPLERWSATTMRCTSCGRNEAV